MGDILFLAHRIPYPPDRGDKIRGFHILEYLAARARVHLVAFADDPGDMVHRAALAERLASCMILSRRKPNAVAAAQALATGRPVSLTAFASRGMRRAVKDVLESADIESIYVFSGQMAGYLPTTSGRRVVMDFVDMDSAKFAAYAQAASGPMAWMHAREARLLQARESAIARSADASLFVSEAEAALFRDTIGASRVQAVENGIDTDFYDPQADFAPVDEAGPLIVFTGQMDYPPNVAAVRWFAEAVLPGIRDRHPRARFAIVGRQPTGAVRALAERPGVIVTGAVADVRGWLAAAAVAVAPLRLARGIQNKVLEAMAMARPVVASTAAAQGIDHAGTIRVAEDAAAMTDAVTRLLDAPDEAAKLGAAARAHSLARYGWDARLAPLGALLDLPAPRVRSAA